MWGGDEPQHGRDPGPIPGWGVYTFWNNKGFSHEAQKKTKMLDCSVWAYIHYGIFWGFQKLWKIPFCIPARFGVYTLWYFAGFFQMYNKTNTRFK